MADYRSGNQPAHRARYLTRRRVLAGMAALPLILAACGRESTTPRSNATLEDFPTGLGRGFPLATVADVDNKGTGVNSGDLAPNFLIQLDDATLAFHDLRGRPRLLNFWATWCGPCRIEMPEIVRAASENDDLLVVAMNVQERIEDVTAFAEDFNMNFLVPLDTEAKVRNAYAVRGMPTSIFIDRDNRIHTVWLGVLTPDALSDLIAEIV